MHRARRAFESAGAHELHLQVKSSEGRGRIRNTTLQLTGSAREEALRLQLRSLQAAEEQVLRELENSNSTMLRAPTRIFQFHEDDFSPFGGLTPFGLWKLQRLNAYANHMDLPLAQGDALNLRCRRALEWRLFAQHSDHIHDIIYAAERPKPYVRMWPRRAWRRFVAEHKRATREAEPRV